MAPARSPIRPTRFAAFFSGRAIGLAGWLAFSSALMGGPTVFPTGVTLYDPGRAYNSYVMIDARDGTTRLVDMDGNEVRTWKYHGFPSEVLDPAVTGGQRGHVFVQLAGEGGHGSTPFRNKTIAELDWDGNVVWQWGDQAPGGSAKQNHDLHRLPNGNTLLIATLVHPVPAFAKPAVNDQCIYEVSPRGDIVWKWVASEHLNEFGFSPPARDLIRSGFAVSAGTTGFLALNNMKVLGPNKWFRNGDGRFHPDNIMIDTREGNVIAIIEKTTGKIVWRLGPDFPGMHDSPHQRAFNNTAPRPVDQISGQHDAHLIPDGLPGAGNLLVLDDQGSAGFPPAYLAFIAGSRVLEIDPVKKEIVWMYNGEDSDRALWSFFTSFMGSARRLPNGNTLICEGMNGRIFQVTPKGEIVWEYVSPYFGRVSLGGRKPLSNWVYRAQPVPYAWAPPGTPHAEKRVVAPDLAKFHIPPAPGTPAAPGGGTGR